MTVKLICILLPLWNVYNMNINQDFISTKPNREATRTKEFRMCAVVRAFQTESREKWGLTTAHGVAGSHLNQPENFRKWTGNYHTYKASAVHPHIQYLSQLLLTNADTRPAAHCHQGHGGRWQWWSLEVVLLPENACTWIGNVRLLTAARKGGEVSELTQQRAERW